jgi:hypothetical protein
VAKGDHIYVKRRGYTHEGIDCGDATVIHYTGRPWQHNASSAVERWPIGDFSRGKEVHTRSYEGEFRYPPDEVVRRAESRLGENRYSLATNNCEHFARWCVSGENKSTQVATVGWTLGLTLGLGLLLWFDSRRR